MEDGGFDDPIEPEDPTDVNQSRTTELQIHYFPFSIF